MPSWLRTSLPLSLFALLAVGQPGLAFAQARDPAVAEELFEKGREAIRRKDYAAACPLFRESQRLEPSVGTLMNIADCDEHEGALARAWEHWHEVIDGMVHAADERVGIARARADALDKRVPRLIVHLTAGTPEAQVTRDDVVLGAASLDLPLPVDPGVHRLVVRAPGRAPGPREVTLREGETLTVSLEAGPVESAPPPAPPLPSGLPHLPEGKPQHPASAQRTAGLVALGVGGASLVLVAISGGVVIEQKDLVNRDCGPDKGCLAAGVDAARAGNTWLTVNAISWVAMVAGGATGLALLLARKTTAVTLAPSALHGGAGVAVTGAF